MSRGRRIAIVVLAGLVAASVAHFVNPAGTGTALIILGSALVIGELLVLRLENGTGVPLSYAVLLVLASSFPVSRSAAAVAGEELISAVLRMADHSSDGARWRAQVMLERLAVAAATIVVYDVVLKLTNPTETVAAVLL